MNAMLDDKPWYTAYQVAALLHISRRQVRRLLRSYRSRCHVARDGRHARHVLWVPAQLVKELVAEREAVWLPKSGEEVG